VLSVGGGAVSVSLGADGMIDLQGAGVELTCGVERAVVASLPDPWLAAAKAYRRAYTHAASVGAEVQS
jgi:hypothetical protein